MKQIIMCAAIVAMGVSASHAEVGLKCTQATYYYMDMAERTNGTLHYKISIRTDETRLSKAQCMTFRSKIQTGNPKVQGTRVLLDATCSPCGPLDQKSIDAIIENKQVWRALMGKHLKREWEKFKRSQ